jgi:hypothetical protein
MLDCIIYLFHKKNFRSLLSKKFISISIVKKYHVSEAVGTLILYTLPPMLYIYRLINYICSLYFYNCVILRSCLL